jgi:hypothetical protein
MRFLLLCLQRRLLHLQYLQQLLLLYLLQLRLLLRLHLKQLLRLHLKQLLLLRRPSLLLLPLRPLQLRLWPHLLLLGSLLQPLQSLLRLCLQLHQLHRWQLQLRQKLHLRQFLLPRLLHQMQLQVLPEHLLRPPHH